LGTANEVDSEYRCTTPEGGLISGFQTDEFTRAEGYHFRPDSPLLMIINEAKAVPDGIFDAFDRNGYNVLLEISTGGIKQGRFYEHWTTQRGDFKHFEASLLDCPHIPKEKIAQLMAWPGPDHPHTRSVLYGEFMDQDDESIAIFSEADIDQIRRRAFKRPKDR
jgi:phage terminase large subunit